MAEVNRETVVVERDQGASNGWLIALGVIALLVILFFSFGGMSMFNGAAGASGAETVNVEGPRMQSAAQ